MAKQLYIKLQTPTVELPVKATDVSGVTQEILVGFKRYDLDQLKAKFDDETTLETQTDIDFFSQEIIYIKNAVLEIHDETGFLEDLVVKDTRTAEPNEFFQSPKEALAVLLGYYLNSSPWKNALIKAQQEALFNTSFADGELKN
jgi:hypothetical protein